MVTSSAQAANEPNGTRLSSDAGNAAQGAGEAMAADSRTPVTTGLIGQESLPRRAFKALVRAGVFCVEDLATRTRRDVLKMHGIGRKSLDDIERYLSQRGITLPADRVEEQ